MPRLNLESLEARALLSGSPTLVSDLTTTSDEHSSGAWLLGDTYLVRGAAADTGIELWTTGENQDSQLVVDFFPGPQSSSPRFIGEVDGKVVIAARTSADLVSVWASDGSKENTVKLAEFPQPYAPARVDPYFERFALWFGTRFGSPQIGEPAAVRSTDDTLYFSAANRTDTSGSAVTEVWMTDGTPTGTEKLFEVDGEQTIHHVGSTQRGTFYRSLDGDLWWRDDTNQGSQKLDSIGNLGVGSPRLSEDGQLIYADGDGNLVLTSGLETHELHASDGSDPVFLGMRDSEVSYLTVQLDAGLISVWQQDLGTLQPTLLKELTVGPDAYVRLQGNLASGEYLFSTRSSETTEVWMLDHVSSEVKQLAEFVGEANTSLFVTSYFDAGSLLSHTTGLWFTDGEDTWQIHDKEQASFITVNSQQANGLVYQADNKLWFSTVTSAPQLLLTLQHSNRLSFYRANNSPTYFVTKNAAMLDELWITDGTPDGTRLLGAFEGAVSIQWSYGSELVYFTVGDGDHVALWGTDATTTGTQKVLDRIVNKTPNFPGSLISSATDGRVHVETVEGGNLQIWELRGYEPVLLPTVPLPTDDSSLSSLTTIGDRLFFVMDQRVWTSDGSDEGTREIANVDYSDSREVGNLAALDGFLYFITTDLGSKTDEIWRTDGGPAQLVIDGLVEPDELTTLGDKLYFSNVHHSQIMQSDGTASGTHKVGSAVAAYSFTELNGKLAYRQRNILGREPWIFDPTTGENRVIKDIAEGPNGSSPTDFVAIDDKLFFNTEREVYSLWVTDGTEAGTSKLLDGKLQSITSVGTSVYLITADEQNVPDNSSLWTTDGSPEGTSQIVISDDSEVWPYHLVGVGGELFAFAFEPQYGDDGQITNTEQSLWKLNASTDWTRVKTLSETHGVILGDDSDEAVTWAVSFDNTMYFDLNGSLYESDGTEEGTNPVSGLEVSDGEYVVTDRELFIVASDLVHGMELWKVESDARVGDINADDAVDFADFLLLSAAYGSNVQPGDAGDLDLDGEVSFADFLILAANYEAAPSV